MLFFFLQLEHNDDKPQRNAGQQVPVRKLFQALAVAPAEERLPGKTGAFSIAPASGYIHFKQAK